MATLIGSSNYGSRSIFRDLESQLLILSSDAAVSKALSAERDTLIAHTDKVDAKTFEDPSRMTSGLLSFTHGSWIRPASIAVKTFL